MKKIVVIILVAMLVVSMGGEVEATKGWEVIDLGEAEYIDLEINIKELGIKEQEIVAVNLIRNGKRQNMNIEIDKEKVKFREELLSGSNYRFRIITESKRYEIKFKTKGLPDITETGDAMIFRIPANPEKGFNWPYIIRVPSDKWGKFMGLTKESKRHLFVEMVNTRGRVNEMVEEMTDLYDNNIGEALSLAEATYSPMITPIIPRTHVKYIDTRNGIEDVNFTYEHQLDRDTIFLHELLKDEKIGKSLKKGFKNKEYNDIDKFIRIDKQVLAMIDHAIEYLREHEYTMDDKVVMVGFSAAGEFSHRFTSLYPHRVKVMVSGGAMEGMVIPSATLKGEELIYPIGVSEYKEITRREFSLEEQNKVARLYYMGEIDNNDTLMSPDCYGEVERNKLIKLFGKDFKTRMKKIEKAYVDSGGKGQMVTNKGVGHDHSHEMMVYKHRFIEQNLVSDTPVYDIKVGKDLKPHIGKLDIRTYK